MNPKPLLSGIIDAVRNAADPYDAVRKAVRGRGSRLRVEGRAYRLDRFSRIWIVGAGKAAAPMAAALEEILGDRLSGGVVVTRYGYGGATRVVRVREAGHPVPDREGLEGAEALLALLKGTARSDLVFVLISGGGSALLPAPARGVSLRDEQRVTGALLRSGATIGEVNAVRKHLSRVKGGGLLRHTPARVVALILSDVVGDRLDVIASGLTEADPTDYAGAVSVLERYGLWSRAPKGVRRHLLLGRRGRIAETVKPGDPILRRVQNVLIAGNRTVVNAAARAAGRSGFRPVILSGSLTGEAKEVARVFGALAREIVFFGKPSGPPVCLLAGGETTVTVRGSGTGGRCQEFALSGAIEIENLPGVLLAAFSSDGMDGPPPVEGLPAAGAYADGRTVINARKRGIDPRGMLDRNDAYGFFSTVGGLIRTGPTRTNLNDLYLLFISGRSKKNQKRL